MGWISTQIANATGLISIKVSSHKRFCSNRGLHGSVVQRYQPISSKRSNSKFTNARSGSSHATIISPREHDNLDNYNKFMNELSVRIEGGWPPPNTLPYNEDLLRHTLGLSPRVKTSDKFYPNSDKHYKRSRHTQEPISNKKTESDQKSTSTGI